MEYNFTITAAGVQIDRKFSKTGIDKTWDAVWKSSVKINNKLAVWAKTRFRSLPVSEKICLIR